MIWDLTPYKTKAEFRGYADSRTVREPGADYWTDANIKAGLIWASHHGLDMGLGGIGTPIYAVQSGHVLEALNVTPAHTESGTYGGWQTGSRVAINAGTYKGMPAAWCYGHLNDYVVAVGQWVEAGQLIGHQGSTGDSTGPHLHLNFFVGMQYYDPLPFLDGRSKSVPDVEEVKTVNIKVIARYKYTDAGFINIRETPSANARDVGDITQGSVFDVEELVDNEGFTWGKMAGGNGDTPSRGYVAIYKGATAWCVPVAVSDNSAELEVLKLDKAALVAERDNERTEVNRLREIILDGPRRMDP